MSNSSGIFNINMQDLKSSLVNAVIAAVISVLYGLTSQGSFDVFHADWAHIGALVLNAAIAAFMGSFGKHFLTDENGTTHLGVMKVQTK